MKVLNPISDVADQWQGSEDERRMRMSSMINMLKIPQSAAVFFKPSISQRLALARVSSSSAGRGDERHKLAQRVHARLVSAS